MMPAPLAFYKSVKCFFIIILCRGKTYYASDPIIAFHAFRLLSSAARSILKQKKAGARLRRKEE